MEQLFQYSNQLIAEVKTDFKRYAFETINWKNKLIGLVGPRGVGKTTLLLQYIKENLSTQNSIYVTTEDFYFAKHSLLEFTDKFVKYGGKHLFIDEIHKYPNWSREIKLIYDYHKDLKVVFTGSSVLDIKKGGFDLSRRALVYKMQGLSFREYLILFHKIHVKKYSLEEILSQRVDSSEIPNPLLLFKSYLKSGYYPFALEEDFEQKLKQIVGQTLETDIPTYAEMTVATGRKLKQLMGIIAQSVPFKPNMSKIAEILNISRNNIADYLFYMEEAGMISQLKQSTSGIRGLGKIEKVYLDNTNLIDVLAKENANVGNLRETFFINQVKLTNQISSSEFADFKIEGIHFELGGPNKGKKQIAAAENAFIVKDELLHAYQNVIPLWHFGLMY